MTVPCFWLEPTGEIQYTRNVWCLACGCENRDEILTEEPDFHDGGWPETCPACGRQYNYDRDAPASSADSTSISTERIYRRVDTGESGHLRDFGPGAMWEISWYEHLASKSVDGRCIAVRLPGGHDWIIDSRANNCTRRDEPHDCWCRHGEPPNLTVDKNPEPGRSTCDAGGGSIWVNQGEPGDWHGFLQRGHLVAVGESL